MAGIEQWLTAWQAILKAETGRFLFSGVILLVCTFVEQLIPAQKGHGFRGRGRNLVFATVYTLLGLGAWSAILTARPLGITPDDGRGRLYSVGLVLAYFMVNDFLYYWYHRAQHRFSFLWAIHELHHADRELNATTSFRTFWAELPVQVAMIGVPTFLLLGFDPWAGVYYPFFATIILIFTHWNVNVNLGPLTRVICGPQVHRIHHSDLPEHRDKNFAQVFPFYDVLFRTYVAPKPGEVPTTGAEELANDASLWTVMTRPLAIWTRPLRGRR